MCGVQNIYIYCGAFATEIEEYIKASIWNPPSTASPFASLEIIKTTARSVGDAMRDLDSRDLITGDFLLVHGDLVSNLPIDGALAAHRARRIADKNAIMTMVLRSAGLEPHRTKTQGITPVFVVDPSKNRCLHYEEINPVQANKYVNLDPDLLSEHGEMEIRTDLIDCGIDICTPDVLALWSDSFDYEVPRRHFLHGVLKDYELNGKTIHTEIIRDHYAARASNLQEYEAVSKDILGRWTFPFVPDSNLLPEHRYKFERGGLCMETGVILARSCRIGKKTVLGKDTSIGDASVVSNSIIGRRCQIGKNVVIENAYIWDDVVIGDGSKVCRSIIASEAVVGRQCNILPGSLLDYGVRIADKTDVKEGTRITRAKRNRDDVEGEHLVRVLADTAIVGPGGEGYAFQDDDEEDEELSLQSSLIYSTSHLNLSSESISTLSSEISAPSEVPDRSRLNSFAGSISDDADSTTGGGGGSGEAFHHDAVADVLRTLTEVGGFDNLRVEFTSLRLSNNASDHQMRRAIAVAFTKRISQLVESGTEASKAASQTLSMSGAEAFVNEVAIGSKKKVEDQVDFLICVQKDLVHRGSGDTILATLCQVLYNSDVIEEEAFEDWWADEKSSDGEEMEKVRAKTEMFMTWLREAEEEESDEDEESE